ncbi:hypothetical protein FKM82_014452 [Ascaphus truei]
MEESFPRGGSQKRSEQVTVKKRPKENDNLFSTHHEEGTETKKRKKSKEDQEKPKTFRQKSEMPSTAEPSVVILKFKNLSVGMLMLGCVKEAKDFELAVSLPYGLTGFVHATNICEAYSKILSEQVEKDVPLEGLTPLSGLYSPGMLVRCAISSLESTAGGFHSVKLSVNPKHVNKALAARSLRTGMLLSGCLSSVEDHGYLIDIGVSGTKAFLPRQKAQVFLNQASKGATLAVGQYLNCVIEDVKNDGRIVRLSVTQSDVAAAFATEEQNWTLNNLLPGLVVKAKIQKVGSDRISLSFLSSYTGIVDFLHFEPKKSNDYQNDQEVKACILWIDPSSKSIRLTLRQSFLQPGNPLRQLASHQIGSMPESCTVKVLYKNTGALFQLDGETLAFAFKNHLLPSKGPVNIEKFKAGTSHTGRITDFSPMDEILILSLKKTVVEGLYLRHDDIQAGQLLEGSVDHIEAVGMVVKVTKHLTGLVPRLHLADVLLHQPEKKYSPGDQIRCRVIKVRVLECEPAQEKLLLSFKLHQEGEEEAAAAEKHYPRKKNALKQETGKLVDTKIVKKTDQGFNVSVLPEETRAFLPKMHLSDHVANCELLWQWLEEGELLPGAMCLSSTKEQNILTKKTALISSLEQGLCVKDICNVQLGMLLTGFVKNIMPYGVFVEFPYGLVGLVPKAQISDKFVTNIREHFVEGQTVVAKVTNADEEKKRILLTLKMSECAPDDCSTGSFSELSQCFTELHLLKGLISKKADPEGGENLSTLVPGKKLSLVVENVEEDGSVLFSVGRIAGARTVSATQHHIAGKSLVAGQKVKAAVLHVDVLKSHVHVSLGATLLCKRKETLKENSAYSAIVQHVAEEFAIASLEGTGQLAAVPVACHFNDTFRFESERFTVGQNISLILKTTSTDEHGILLAVQNPADMRTNKKVDQKTPASNVSSTAMKHGLRVGEVVTGTVKTVKPTCVLVSISDKVVGTIHVSQIMEDCPLGSFPTSKLKPKQSVTCRVIGGKDVKTHRFLPITHPHFKQSVPELSILPSLMNVEDRVPPATELKTYTAGQKVTCYVLKYNKEKKYLEVEIAPEIRGRVELLLLSQSSKILKRPEKSFKHGQALSATVVGPDITHTHLCLSLTEVYTLSEGSVLIGCVKKVIPGTGLVVSLPFGKTGKAGLFHISDCYAEASLENFSAGKFVGCCIVSTSKTIEVSLRQSRTNPRSKSNVVDAEIPSIDKLEVGQLVSGFVGSITDKGVFFRLSSSIVGHIQFQQVTRYYVPGLSLYEKYIPEGTSLTAKILCVDTKENHVALSLLPEETGKPDVIPVSAGLRPRKNKEDKKQNKKGKRKRTDSESESQDISPKKKKSQGSHEDEDSGVEVYCREEENENKKGKSLKEQKENALVKTPVSRLKVLSGFSWDVNLNTLKTASAAAKEEQSSDSDDDEKQPKTKKTQKEKVMEKKQAEKELSKLEATLMDVHRQPQSAEDFDRLVLGSPNSSILWLQYMAFHLHATEIEKARAVAERALKTISFREEQEKLNVWVALLNLENLYGTEETLLKAFERAVQYNEPLKVFQQLADIYIKSEKFKQAEDLYNTMLKRFRQEKSVWLKYGTFLLKQGQTDATHRLLQRALKGLPDKEHVDVISKFAQLEFHLGDVERAKALFESTLSNYPKRTDLWSVYIDMMMKHGSQKEVRDIFERVIHLSLAAKRIKFFFKRYLEYEKKHGSPESVQAVKEKALEYVEAKSSLTKT